MIKDIIIIVILWAVFYNLITCKQEYKAPEQTYNGADTLKIMIVNDSITSIKPYKKHKPST